MSINAARKRAAYTWQDGQLEISLSKTAALHEVEEEPLVKRSIPRIRSRRGSEGLDE